MLNDVLHSLRVYTNGHRKWVSHLCTPKEFVQDPWYTTYSALKMVADQNVTLVTMTQISSK